MALHIRKAMNELQKSFAKLCVLVESSVNDAIKAVETRDDELARKIETQDVNIDRMEVEIEEECLKIIALYQPVAVDLRVLTAVLKINNDLERIGDLAQNIAMAAIRLDNTFVLPFDFSLMSKRVSHMLKTALDSFMELNPEKALETFPLDDDVDSIKSETFTRIIELLEKCGTDANNLLQSLSIANHLERIADLATNIGEDVIYIVDGRIVRHMQK
ncbi:MAG TPA: phosphate signaling complex protein PhoU [Caldisericia bacterium]|nr:phosphate signaling complex protein PhoU [Caldisericia bacterium]HPF49424.1 phosphate signaling complex protein PhoU [Caldisericia bacterium]HPI84373.1 phosphate signaling complex protein PhoU [Caldisericia bacterium]HPQ93595.1 phosphate signaling complex protein PhoU [Caldisericia bacterium]HRV75564.1 phosphate signaling complex protein PhoU [Caldisericia bacterium]